MMKNFPALKNFLWVIYPLVVAGLILYTVNMWQSGGVGKINQLLSKQGETMDAQQKLAILQQKLTGLQAVDLQKENGDLTWTLGVFPVIKQVGAMLAEVSDAASSSGTTINRYSGTVGEVTEASAAATLQNLPISLQAEFKVTNFGQVQQIISSLAKSLPLLQISTVSFESTTAKITLVGAWAAWGKISTEALTPLPVYKDLLTKLKVRLQDFATLPVVDVGSVASGSGTVNPF